MLCQVPEKCVVQVRCWNPRSSFMYREEQKRTTLLFSAHCPTLTKPTAPWRVSFSSDNSWHSITCFTIKKQHAHLVPVHSKKIQFCNLKIRVLKWLWYLSVGRMCVFNSKENTIVVIPEYFGLKKSDLFWNQSKKVGPMHTKFDTIECKYCIIWNKVLQIWYFWHPLN